MKFLQFLLPKMSSTSEKTVTRTVSKKQTQDELVQEIHDTFYTEVDRLLADAKIMRPYANPQPLPDKQQSIIETGKRHIKLGFTTTKEKR